MDLNKLPGVAETLDWARRWGALGMHELSSAAVQDTLGMILKYQDDIDKLRGGAAGGYKLTRRQSRWRLIAVRYQSTSLHLHILEQHSLAISSRTPAVTAGLPIGLDQALAFAQALEWIDLGAREQVYPTGRSLLVSRYEHLRLFDAIFNRFWRAPARIRAPAAAKDAARAAAQAARSAVFDCHIDGRKAGLNDPEVDVSDKSGTASMVEVLQRKEFSQMTPEELERIKRLIQQMRWRISLRETRASGSGTGAAICCICARWCAMRRSTAAGSRGWSGSAARSSSARW